MSNDILLKEVGMKNIYVVSSGRRESLGGINILVLRAFTTYEKAEAWIESEIKRDPSFNENYDSYEIDEVTLYE